MFKVAYEVRQDRTASDLALKAVFHSIISPPPAKNFDIEIIFYIHASLKKFVLLHGPVVENFHLLFDFADGTKEQLIKFFASGGEIREWKTGLSLTQTWIRVPTLAPA